MRRIERVLVSRGILTDDPSPTGSDELEESLLPFVQAASIQSKVALGPESGRSIPRLLDPAIAVRSEQTASPATDELCYESAGYSLHAATRIEAEDRDRLERLVRYVARPALAQGRLEVRSDGKIKWSLRRPWRDGTRAFVFDPMTFLERLVALVPHPREHQLTYFGVLAPASPLRDAVVPARPQTKREPDTDEPDPCTHAARRTWAQLLKRTFGIDVLRCPRCGGRRHQIATITDPLVARKILAHLRMRCEPPALAPARHSLQLRFE